MARFDLGAQSLEGRLPPLVGASMVLRFTHPDIVDTVTVADLNWQLWVQPAGQPDPASAIIAGVVTNAAEEATVVLDDLDDLVFGRDYLIVLSVGQGVAMGHTSRSALSSGEPVGAIPVTVQQGSATIPLELIVAPNGVHNDLAGRDANDAHPASAISGLSAVATTGDYDDLDNLPSIPDISNLVDTSDPRLSDTRQPTAHKSTHSTGGTDPLSPSDIGAATSAQGSLADSAVQPGSLAAVATSGDYDDLSNKPAIPDVSSFVTQSDIDDRVPDPTGQADGRILVVDADALVYDDPPSGGGGAALSDATPQNLGTAAAGTSADASRADHVHAMPSAGDVGAAPSSRNITAGTGLTGGGDLTADRTLTVSYGTAAGTAAQGNDSRLSDSRTPTGTAGGDLSGTFPNPTIANSAVTSAKILDGTIVDADISASAAIAQSKVANLTTDLGGKLSATDPSVTNARTPTAHKSTHATAGSDALTPSDIGAAAAARNITAGTGLSGGGDLTADRTLSVTFGATAGTAAEGNDSRLTNARTPTEHGETHFLAGSDPISPSDIGAAAATHSHAGEDITSGTINADRIPTLAQSKVTNLETDLSGKLSATDPSVTNARTPTAHKSTHATAGSDALSASDIGAAAASHVHAGEDITSGTIGTARLGSGTASATTFLRGDGAWAAPPASFPVAGTGRLYRPPTYGTAVSGTVAVIQDRLYAVRMPLGAGTLDQLIVRHISVNQAGEVLRVGVYADDNGRPGALIVDGGNVDLSAGSNATKTVTISATITTGIYWLAAVQQGGNAARIATFQFPSQHSSIDPAWTELSSSNPPWDTNVSHVYVSSVTGALPDPFGTATLSETGGTNRNVPLVAVRYA